MAEIALWDSDRTFSLPAEGTPSMLLRFGGPDGVMIGVRATDAAGVRFDPGTEHKEVHLVFWANETEDVVAAGATFDVWYGKDIGSGRITAVSRAMSI